VGLTFWRHVDITLHYGCHTPHYYDIRLHTLRAMLLLLLPLPWRAMLPYYIADYMPLGYAIVLRFSLIMIALLIRHTPLILPPLLRRQAFFFATYHHHTLDVILLTLFIDITIIIS